MHVAIIQKVSVTIHLSITNARSLGNKQICKWSDKRKQKQTTPQLRIAEVATYQYGIITDTTKRDQLGN